MKRKLALLMACVLMIGTLAACGGSGAGDGGVPTLTWYLNGTRPADCDLVEAEVNKISEPKIGAKLKFVWLDGGAYDEKMNMMMASNTEFDLCFSGYTNKYQRGVSMGGFLKLNEYLDKMPGLKNAIPDYAWKAVEVNGGDIYAVPNLQIYAMWQGIFITKEYADKYNLDIASIKKVEDLEPFLKQIHDNEPDVYGFNPTLYPWNGVGSELIISNMGDIRVDNEDETATLFKSYDTKEYLEGAKVLRDFYKKGYIRQDIASAANDSTSSKQTVVTIGAYKPGAEKETALSTRGECYAIPLGEPCVSSEMALQTLTAVSVTSKNPEKAVKLLELVNTDKELFRLIVHGIEGKHYEVLESGHIRPMNTEGYNFHTGGWRFGNCFNSYVTEGRDIDVWEQTAKLNETARKSKLLGFTLDTTNIVNEVANLGAIHAEFNGLAKGSVDTETTLEAYKKKMTEAGIDKVMEEAQRQINEFLKNNKG